MQQLFKQHRQYNDLQFIPSWPLSVLPKGLNCIATINSFGRFKRLELYCNDQLIVQL